MADLQFCFFKNVRYRFVWQLILLILLMCIFFVEKGVALFHDSELERVFGIIPPHSVDDLLRSYIHDFAFLAHRSVNAVGHKVSQWSELL